MNYANHPFRSPFRANKACLIVNKKGAFKEMKQKNLNLFHPVPKKIILKNLTYHDLDLDRDLYSRPSSE